MLQSKRKEWQTFLVQHVQPLGDAMDRCTTAASTDKRGLCEVSRGRLDDSSQNTDGFSKKSKGRSPPAVQGAKLLRHASQLLRHRRQRGLLGSQHVGGGLPTPHARLKRLDHRGLPPRGGGLQAQARGGLAQRLLRFYDKPVGPGEHCLWRLCLSGVRGLLPC